MYKYNVPVVTREFPRGFATRGGFNTQNPVGRTNAFDIPEIDMSEAGAANKIIWQGMIMSVTEDGKSWQRGVPADETPGIIAIANNDQLDDDVMNARTLVGLSCAGQYTYATPYFAHTSDPESGEQYSYVAGTYLTYCKNDEVDTYNDVIDGAVVERTRSLAGFVRPAKAGEEVIGRVSQTGVGPYKANPVTWEGDPDAEGRGIIAPGLNRNAAPFADTYKMPKGVWPLQATIGAAVDSSSKINNAYMLVFETLHTGAKA